MRWPWPKAETRESGGDFSDAVVRLLGKRSVVGIFTEPLLPGLNKFI